MRKRTLPPATLLSLWIVLILASCGGRLEPTSPQLPTPPQASGPSSVGTAAGGAPPEASAPSPIKAGYFYDYLPVYHLDSLKATGFNRALIKWIADSLGSGAGRLRAWAGRGASIGIEVTPTWTLQARARLQSLPSSRRYTWGAGRRENDVACPLDSLFWRSALIDRAEEMLRAAPGIGRMAVDLELYAGSRHHYDVGPCRCLSCLREFQGANRLANPTGLALERFEWDRLTRMLTSLLTGFAAAHPGVEIGIFDLDFDSFVHRAVAVALMRAQVPTVDYTERTYARGAGGVQEARAALDAIGVSAPVVGGLWLQRVPPESLGVALQSASKGAAGYFVFTTYSLWLEPGKLKGPYTLLGPQSRYWSAFRRANR